MTPGNRREARNLSDVDPFSFGGQLRRLRDEAGLTQAQLGEAVGLPQTRISEYERGSHKPQEDVIVDLAKALNVKPGLLMESAQWDGALLVGSKRREKLKQLHESDWRMFDHVLDVIGDVTPQERARFEDGFRKFLDNWR